MDKKLKMKRAEKSLATGARSRGRRLPLKVLMLPGAVLAGLPAVAQDGASGAPI